jgi:hypothetical protein
LDTPSYISKLVSSLQDFPPKLWLHFPSPIRATCLANHTLLDVMALIISGEECKLNLPIGGSFNKLS